MNIHRVIELRQRSLACIEEMFLAVTEGRFDNTHTTTRLNAASAMHEAACREYDDYNHQGHWLPEEPSMVHAIDWVEQAIKERPELAVELTAVLEDLRALPPEGGDA